MRLFSSPPAISPRVFKTAKFSGKAKKRGITDKELCIAIRMVQASPATYSLGGEVYKKRLNNNMDRSIILARGGTHWFYAHLFQKSDVDNITGSELEAYKQLARLFGKLSDTDLTAAAQAGEFEEICHEKSN